ncbi:MAG: hypothetical protein SFU98_13720 [Leptospiraceae bacterium]|nr:hypothetical protein [Leptospiraceae bacterium]
MKRANIIQIIFVNLYNILDFSNILFKKLVKYFFVIALVFTHWSIHSEEIKSKNQYCNPKLVKNILENIDNYKYLKKYINKKNVNCKDKETGDTVLTKLLATYTIDIKTQLKILTLFLKSGANPNQRNLEGKSPLHLSLEYDDNIKIIKVLLKFGADINILDFDGNNYMFDLIISDVRDFEFQRDNLNFFVKNKGDINFINKNGDNLLLYLLKHLKKSRHDFSVLIIALHNKKININQKDSNGDTALSLSKKNPYTKKEQIDTLLKLGAK